MGGYQSLLVGGVTVSELWAWEDSSKGVSRRQEADTERERVRQDVWKINGAKLSWATDLSSLTSDFNTSHFYTTGGKKRGREQEQQAERNWSSVKRKRERESVSRGAEEVVRPSSLWAESGNISSGWFEQLLGSGRLFLSTEDKPSFNCLSIACWWPSHMLQCCFNNSILLMHRLCMSPHAHEGDKPTLVGMLYSSFHC